MTQRDFGSSRILPLLLLLGTLPAASQEIVSSEQSQSFTRPKNQLVTSGIEGTCFPQDSNPNAGRLAKATLQTHLGKSLDIVPILGIDVIQGSAVVIADSHDSSGINRLLTVGHVLGDHPRRGNHEVTLTASDNFIIGTAIPAAIPWRYRRGGSKYDISVLKIRSFASKEAEEKYRAIKGVELAPIQAKSGYMQGLINDPVPPNEGSSGGPVVDENGQLVGLVDFIIMRSKTRKVHAVAIGPYAKLSDNDMESAIEGRTFAVSVTPHSIWKALGPAGQKIISGLPSNSNITEASYPGGYCTYSHGYMAPVIKFDAAVTNFDTPAGQTAAQGSFTHWRHPKAVYVEVQRLLVQAKAEHLSNETEIDNVLKAFNQSGQLKQIKFVSYEGSSGATATIDSLTEILRKASKETRNPTLAKDMLAASENLPVTWFVATSGSMPKRLLNRLLP